MAGLAFYLVGSGAGAGVRCCSNAKWSRIFFLSFAALVLIDKSTPLKDASNRLAIMLKTGAYRLPL